MTIQEAIKQHEKAQKENSKAQQAAREAAQIARDSWHNVILEKHSRISPEYIAASEASEKETAANKAANIAKAIEKAAADNVLNAAANTLRAAILANPSAFNKPVHFKKFEEAVKEITGPEFYLDNQYTYSFYIRYKKADYNHDSTFICEKDAGALKIDPEKLRQVRPEFTLKEIKAEAKKAIKDAEKLRKASEDLQKLAKSTRAKYRTYIEYLLPDYYSGTFKDSKLF